MLTKSHSQQRAGAAAELLEHCPNCDSSHIVVSLSAGLTHVRDLMMTRIHEDVEQCFGIDSMIAPVSQRDGENQARKAKKEIEIYSAIVVDDEVTHNRYVQRPGSWFLNWLFQLRLGDEDAGLLAKRVEFYRSRSAEDRRLKFLSYLQSVMPESLRTPLVLFRLFPRAVRIVAAVAFGDVPRARQLRDEQYRFLPALGDCVECHGRVLDNEEICRVCGNPVWEFAWLQAD